MLHNSINSKIYILLINIPIVAIMEKVKKYLIWQMFIMDFIFVFLFTYKIFIKIIDNDLMPGRITFKQYMIYLIINSIFFVISLISIIFYQWMDKRVNNAIIQKTDGKYKQKANKKIIIPAGIILAVLIVSLIMGIFFPSIDKLILLIIEIVI